MPEVEELALAKVNLDLCVTGRRGDGYHELDSLVVFAEPADRLRFRKTDRLRLELDGPLGVVLAGQSDNLV
ncbi:MAG: 4-(cytidine 5'-diphospho)-2-C-methyl-D-erythritol kinase, partial [Geminicoccaceae bacterium]